MEQSTVNQRLNLLVDTFENGVKAAFARKAGISPQGAQELLAGRKGDPSFKVLVKILESYPTVNANWLVLGQGEMIKTEEWVNPFAGAYNGDEKGKRQFLPPMEEINKRREEEWAQYHKEVEQREKDRVALRALVEHLAKSDASGELAKIQQLLPSALKHDIDPDQMEGLMDAEWERRTDEYNADQQAEWERQRQEREGK